MKIFGKSWRKLILSPKKECDLVLIAQFFSTLKTDLSLQEYQVEEWKSLQNTQ